MSITQRKSAKISTIITSLIDGLIIILAILVVGNLLFGGIAFLLGWQETQQEIFRQTTSTALVHIVLHIGIIACEGIAQWSWRRKNRQKDWDTAYRVLKCSPSVFALPICGVLLLLMAVLLFCDASAGELSALWENGTLTFPLLFLLGYNILAIAFFLYYTRQKVFFSRYSFQLVNFWKNDDIPWTQVREMTLSRKKNKSRFTIVTSEKMVVLRSEILADGWNDFLYWARQMSETYRIPFTEIK